MKRILITGANSYIGTSFEKYMEDKEGYEIDTLDMRNQNWLNYDFSKYGVVFHVAGIAHADVGKVSEETKKLYYKVNTELTLETAKKAKDEGVTQFIYMSSIIVYGESAPLGKKKVITKETEPNPANFYGDSKLQADIGLMLLNDDAFKVCILRPPMIYGAGSKGNYQMLTKLANKLPVFPDIKNERSMLYIGNLCFFVRECIEKEKVGIYFPQNEEYVNTSIMMKEIGKIHKRNIRLVKWLNPFMYLASKIPGKIGLMTNKAFGNLTYAKTHIIHNVTLKDSIKKSALNVEKPNILFLVNHEIVIYNFRKELVCELIKKEYNVYISSPIGEKTKKLEEIGAKVIPIKIDRHGKSISTDFILIINYLRLIRKIKPLTVLTYTIKPNIYGGFACRLLKVPCIVNITGLGTAVERDGLMQKLTVLLYKISMKYAQCIFFQNEENMNFFKKKHITDSKYKLLPGSGVNLKEYRLLPYPKSNQIHFLFIARVMKEKGIEEYLHTAKHIKEKYPNTFFHILGFCEEQYDNVLSKYQKDGIIQYHGLVDNVINHHAYSSCTIHPSYYPEGISNVLLESCACGRPIITTSRSGCKEVVKPNVNGFLFEPKNKLQLIDKVEEFISLTKDEKERMGIEGRKLVEKDFNRDIIIQSYLDEIVLIHGGMPDEK